MNCINTVLLLSLVAAASCLPAAKVAKPAKDVTETNEARAAREELRDARVSLEEQEAASAQYHFASDVQDGISDLSQQREEIRDGLNVKGFYSYSDGHYRRKVSYEADENGYRVIGEEEEPLDGPQQNPDGSASVHTVAHGNELAYTVMGDDQTRHRQHAQEAAVA